MTELNPASDEQLARQAQAGDATAFEELVSRFERRIYGFALASCRNEPDAREITQDTFVRAHAALARYDADRPFAGWLFTIARRKCIDHHRSGASPAPRPEPEATDPADPAEQMALREERQNLWEVARHLLPEAQFHAIWLRYAEDMDVSQIARVLRKTQTNTKVLLFRARLALGRELRPLERSPLAPTGSAGHPAVGGGAPPTPPIIGLRLAGRKGSP